MMPTTDQGTGAQTATATPCGALRRPAELNSAIDVSGLVDSQGGLLDRAVFTDDRIYRQEMRRIFATSWLFLAHIDQFHKPGDFFTTYMDPLWRDLHKITAPTLLLWGRDDRTITLDGSQIMRRRFSRRQRSETCSCADSMTNACGFATTICSPSSSSGASNATNPSASRSCMRPALTWSSCRGCSGPRVCRALMIPTLLYCRGPT